MGIFLVKGWGGGFASRKGACDFLNGNFFSILVEFAGEFFAMIRFLPADEGPIGVGQFLPELGDQFMPMDLETVD